MTLADMIKNYGGNACITIEGYCEEERYAYYTIPDEDQEDFLGNNPNHHIPSCIAKEPWWNEVKDRGIKCWNIIGGGMYKVELTITLDDN